MDSERFDAVARSLGTGASRRGAMALLAGLAGLGLREAATRARGTRRRGRGRVRAQDATRVTVCHKPGTPAEKTLDIDDNALAAHLRHGDTEGPCCELERRCVDAAGAEVCCPGDQVCGIVDFPPDDAGCCRPAGTELPGGCDFGTIETCCFLPCTPGSTTCLIRTCSPDSGRCCLGGLLPCADDDECCPGLTCQGGQCATAAGVARSAETISQVQER